MPGNLELLSQVSRGLLPGPGSQDRQPEAPAIPVHKAQAYTQVWGASCLRPGLAALQQVLGKEALPPHLKGG